MITGASQPNGSNNDAISESIDRLVITLLEVFIDTLNWKLSGFGFQLRPSVDTVSSKVISLFDIIKFELGRMLGLVAAHLCN